MKKPIIEHWGRATSIWTIVLVKVVNVFLCVVKGHQAHKVQSQTLDTDIQTECLSMWGSLCLPNETFYNSTHPNERI